MTTYHVTRAHVIGKDVTRARDARILVIRVMIAQAITARVT